MLASVVLRQTLGTKKGWVGEGGGNLLRGDPADPQYGRSRRCCPNNAIELNAVYPQRTSVLLHRLRDLRTFCFQKAMFAMMMPHLNVLAELTGGEEG